MRTKNKQNKSRYNTYYYFQDENKQMRNKLETMNEMKKLSQELDNFDTLTKVFALRDPKDIDFNKINEI